MQTKPQLIGYWVTTSLVAAALLAGGCAQLAAVPQTVEGVHSLGYPLYVLTIMGAWKVLGAAALLAPRLPRLKEWAYAGIFFDLSAGAASHAFSQHAVSEMVTPLALLLLALASWSLRPPARWLGSLSGCK
jgi:uncharacterized membrane protein YphA (DoxX/SURF4 family)